MLDRIAEKLKNVEAHYRQFFFKHIVDVPVVFSQVKNVSYSNLIKFVDQLAWSPIQAGAKWGGDNITGFFQGEIFIPESIEGKIFIEAQVGAPEALLLVNGDPKGVFDANHSVVILSQNAHATEKYKILLEAYAGHCLQGFHPYDKAKIVENDSLVYDGIRIVILRDEVIGFVLDLKILLQLVDCLDKNELRYHKILLSLKKVYEIVDLMPSEEQVDRCICKLIEARTVMKPLLQSTNGDTMPYVGLTGHSHIDTAWLWPIAETKRKCVRTFSSVVNLLDQYPEFRFMQSVPYHIELISDLSPSLVASIKQLVTSGRWEPNGGMYVEADCNIPSGEALIRQLLFGQQTTREFYNYSSDTLWLPDTFGYSAALPQILKGCGISFFCTTKLAWNDTTQFPYNTFMWRGIDGSSIVTHFNVIHYPPDPKTLIEHWYKMPNKTVEDRFLCAFGFGDGGGGPNFEEIEITRRISDLEGCPRTTYVSVSDFMQSLESTASDLPIWDGELYLELHRGTLTSIGKIKKMNRLAEFELRNAEFLCTAQALRGKPYPAKEFRQIWKKLLVNQFHDILPGSSIAEVNDLAVAELTECYTDCKAIINRNLARQLCESGSDRQLLIINTLSWDRSDEIILGSLHSPVALIPDCEAATYQFFNDFDNVSQIVIGGIKVDSLSSKIIPLKQGEPAKIKTVFKIGANSVETPYARVHFDGFGRINSLFDKRACRELVVKDGTLNKFLLGDDVPLQWDNWDIDYDQKFKMQEEKRVICREVISNGPVQLRIRSEYSIGENSKILQDMVFHSASAQIDFFTRIDWHEKHKLLCTGFDLAVPVNQARYEIQYGHVERPTYENRTTDRAQFEVSVHKWADLSDSSFGVAVLNDSKYGMSIRKSYVRVSLIKSGTHPDTRGDAGIHEFTYALLPHDKCFSVESVIRPAYELNVPHIKHVTSSEINLFSSFLRIGQPNIIAETIKWAEDENGFIVRLYEAGKMATHANIEFGVPVRKVWETDLLEENRREITLNGHNVSMYFRPFEIKTLYCSCR